MKDSGPFGPLAERVDYIGSGWETVRRVLARFGKRDPVVEILNRFARKHAHAVVVQIGSHDGVTNDPLWPFLRRRQWTGLLVEPLPEQFQRLQRRHADNPRLSLANLVVAEQDGECEFWRVHPAPGQPHWAVQLASLNREVIMGHADRIDHLEECMESSRVTCLTLDSLLARYGVADFDLLHVDTEGADAAILRQVDFRRWHPAVILYEHKHLSSQDGDDCRVRLEREGFALASRRGDTIAWRGLD